jgi:Icc-related predicted phosphoesterase
MKINLVSDMHLNFHDIEMPGGDVLIMAGDIMEAGHLRKADNAKRDVFLADRYRRFIREELSKYRHVIYVMGNHEHYNNSFHDTYDRLSKELPSNVHFLEKDSVKIDDVWFYGGTFWTDMNKGDPVSLHQIKYNMSDFRVINFGNGVKVKTAYGGEYYTSRFTPEYAKSVFHETVESLKTFLAQHVDDKVVVVSHHAPTELSIDPAYKDEYHMNGAYHSRLGDFILDHPQIKTWVHGHMHNFTDYMIGDTRVIANPRGYKGYEAIADTFDPNFSFEV